VYVCRLSVHPVQVREWAASRGRLRDVHHSERASGSTEGSVRAERARASTSAVSGECHFLCCRQRILMSPSL